MPECSRGLANFRVSIRMRSRPTAFAGIRRAARRAKNRSKQPEKRKFWSLSVESSVLQLLVRLVALDASLGDHLFHPDLLLAEIENFWRAFIIESMLPAP